MSDPNFPVLIAILIQKLGGSVTITRQELLELYGKTSRIISETTADGDLMLTLEDTRRPDEIPEL